MKLRLKQDHFNLVIAGLLIIIIGACNNQTQSTSDRTAKLNVFDSVSHGYNELSNPDNPKSFAISDFNTDNPEVKNIDRPSKSKIWTKLDTTLLFGIWTSDPNGPHADFKLTSKSFYVVDYDGDGEMPYELTSNSMKIYYNDFIQEGNIISVEKDTLKIMWKGFENITNYVRWMQ